jgi:hypothetical protein
MKVIKDYIHQLVRRVVIGMSNRDVLIHGFRNSRSQFWIEFEENERIKYALEHPWVFNYNFGHLQLIEKRLIRVI